MVNLWGSTSSFSSILSISYNCKSIHVEGSMNGEKKGRKKERKKERKKDRCDMVRNEVVTI